MSRELVNTGREFESKIAHSAGVVAEGRFLFTSGITSRDDVGDIVGVERGGLQYLQTQLESGPLYRRSAGPAPPPAGPVGIGDHGEDFVAAGGHLPERGNGEFRRPHKYDLHAAVSSS